MSPSATIAFDGSLIHPGDDRVDLRVGQRHIVLELLDADAAVDVPGRHLARIHARLDGLGPRARLLKRHQRHRRNRSRLMTGLTLGLKDRRHVLGERSCLGLLAGDGGNRQGE